MNLLYITLFLIQMLLWILCSLIAVSYAEILLWFYRLAVLVGLSFVNRSTLLLVVRYRSGEREPIFMLSIIWKPFYFFHICGEPMVCAFLTWSVNPGILDSIQIVRHIFWSWCTTSQMFYLYVCGSARYWSRIDVAILRGGWRFCFSD